MEVSPFWGIQQSRCLPPYLKMETDPVAETSFSCFFLFKYRSMDQVQEASNSGWKLLFGRKLMASAFTCDVRKYVVVCKAVYGVCT
jgi:hypothetical protein